MPPPNPVTYNISITSKAIKSFRDLNPALISAHLSLLPNTPRSSIRIITHMLHSSQGKWFYAAGTGEDEMHYRFIQVVIEVVTGSLTGEEKGQLMRRVVEVCGEYEGKRKEETEVEVRVSEVDEGDVLWVKGGGRSGLEGGGR